MIGGLALFIFGMDVMSAGLREATGHRLRKILAKATRNRVAGVGLGTAIGFLVQSSASTVMIVGFINAGLMTLAQSVPPMLGVNLGTTLSMQLISFKLADYCFVAIAAGFIVSMTAPRPSVKAIGRALMGFGLLFLGMNTMSDAIQPYREVFAPWLAHANGSTLRGMLTGVLISAGITGVIQSSGATIGMGFALISSGVITSIEGIFPIIVGANIGTCVTAMLGSIGTTVDARRSAFSHLFFNIFSAAAAIVAAPLFYRYMPTTSGDLIHQAANANTTKMLFSILIILPLTPLYARIVVKLTPSRKKPMSPSFLDDTLLNRPEMAIYATLRELQRVGAICVESFQLNSDFMLKRERRIMRHIKISEASINDIKTAMKDFVTSITFRHLSKRQAILLQHVDRCMSDIERIGDHIDKLSDITERRSRLISARFSPELLELWYALHRASAKVLELGIKSLDPDCENFNAMGTMLIETHAAYREISVHTREQLYTMMAENQVTPIAGVYFRDYLSVFDRMAKHIKSIAQAEQQPYFRIKHRKLDNITNVASTLTPPQTVNANKFPADMKNG